MKLTNNLTYEQWKDAIDQKLLAEVGLDQGCLSDWLSRDAYESGASVDDGVYECLKQSDYYATEGFLVDEL